MDIKRAKKEIQDSIEAYLLKDAYGEYRIPAIRQRPILLMGPPGIGKTQIMEQIARECGIGLVAYTITHHTRQSAVGLPFIKETCYDGKQYSVTEYTMSEIIAAVYEKMERTKVKEGILFIDEINCVSETLAPTMLQFLQCKTFGNQKVPQGWIIVAAGNPPEYNRSVRDFDVVTLDRIKKIDVEENYEVWKEYAWRVHIHPAILTYLELKKENFYRIETNVDGRIFVTARGWEDLSELLKVYEMTGKKADREVVHQYVQHWKIAKDFANYLELFTKYKKDYGLEDILEGHYSKDTIETLKYAAFDERLSVVGMLLGKLSGLFKDYFEKDQYVTILHRWLRQYKSSEDLEDTVRAAQREYTDQRKAEMLTKDQDHVYQEALNRLDAFRQMSAAQRLKGEQQFDSARQAFKQDTELREQKALEALEALEHVFRFLEDAFGDSQEMAAFVTELNTNYYSIRFLKDYDCDLYYRYNKRLLFDEQQADILEKLTEVENELDTELK